MSEPEALWERLDEPWRVVFTEAWRSWRDGNFGIGAALVDPTAGDIVSVGRNRVAEREALPGLLSGNMTAHAEMNAFAALDRFNADGLHVYTTLEPCLMCASTAMLLKVAHVHFAERDEFFEGMDELWAGHPVTAVRRPGSTGPLDGDRRPLAAFARLLPLAFTLREFPGRTAERLARSTHPGLAQVADDLAQDQTFRSIREDGSVLDALRHLWPDLTR